MSFTDSSDTREQVRQATDLVDLVGSSIPLRRQGSRYVGICPWHDDTRPSLQVNPDRQSWKCWVCDIGGDVFSFVMQQEGVGFREALEMLAERAGIPLRRTSGRSDGPDKRTLYEALAWAQQQYHECLLRSAEAEPARRYLRERGLTEDSWARFHLGYAPQRWQWLLDRAHGKYQPDLLAMAGLVGHGRQSGQPYDFFTGRVIFPIRDTQGRPIAFGGRVLPELAKPDTVKYINTRETKLFSKSEHVYGLDQARGSMVKRRQAVVVEGYTDVMMAHQFGIQNVVAVLGTALGARHIHLLRRYADVMTLVLDGDAAGQRRANEVLELFVASEVDLRILTLPEGLDPCDYLLTHGSQQLETALANAPDALEHAVQSQLHGLDPLQDTHRAHQSLERLLSVLSRAPRLSQQTSSAKVLRERQLLARLARELRVEEGLLRTRLAEMRRGSRPPAGSNRQTALTPASKLTLKDLDPHEVELFEILAVHAELVDMLLEEVAGEHLVTPGGRALWEAYRQLAEHGEETSFERILAHVETPDLKHLLVTLDEQAQAKEPHAQQEPPARMRRLMDDLLYRAQETQRRETMAVLEQQTLAGKEELDALQELFEQERRRQGIPAPTDG